MKNFLMIAGGLILGFVLAAGVHSLVKGPTGSDSFLNPSAGNSAWQISGVNIVPLNPFFWTVGNLQTNAQFGTVQIGGTGTSSQVNLVGNGTAAFNTVTLGPIQGTTSTVTSTVSIPVAGFTVGNPCTAGLTTVPTSTPFGGDGFITAVTSTNATATMTFWNGAATAVTISTGTITAQCQR